MKKAEQQTTTPVIEANEQAPDGPIVATPVIPENHIAAMHGAYEDTGYVHRSRKNTHQNFTYAGEADLIKAVRPQLHAMGYTVRPVGIRVLCNETLIRKTKDGNERMDFRFVAEYTFEFLHVSGEKLWAVAVGEGIDSGDKASYKAATGALKYALRQSLLIETGDDPEEDRERQEAERYAKLQAHTNNDAKMREAMDAAPTLEVLKAIWEENAGLREAMDREQPVMYQQLRHSFQRKAKKLTDAVAKKEGLTDEQ